MALYCLISIKISHQWLYIFFIVYIAQPDVKSQKQFLNIIYKLKLRFEKYYGSRCLNAE